MVAADLISEMRGKPTLVLNAALARVEVPFGIRRYALRKPERQTIDLGAVIFDLDHLKAFNGHYRRL